MKTKIKTSQELLATLTITSYLNEEVVKTMPTDSSEDTIEFFNGGKNISNSELVAKYEKRGLIPAYPHDIIALCKESQPHDLIATVWDFDDKNTLSYLAFVRWDDDERRVNVLRDDVVWSGGWWFAGLRKSVLGTHDTKPSSESLPLDLSDVKVKLRAFIESLEELENKL